MISVSDNQFKIEIHHNDNIDKNGRIIPKDVFDKAMNEFIVKNPIVTMDDGVNDSIPVGTIISGDSSEITVELNDSGKELL